MTSPQPVTSPQPALAPRLPALTGLRAVAAFLVFFNHGGYIIAHSDPELYGMIAFLTWKAGPMSLAFFFVLSGFVLTWAARPGDTARGFWRGRILKIFPNHIVVYVIALCLILASSDQIHVLPAVLNFFLLQAWVPETTFFMFPVNGVTWSVSAELLFYACFPLLIVIVNKIRPSRLWMWACLVLAAVLAVPAFASVVLPDQPPSLFAAQGVGSWYQHWFVFFSPFTRALEFVTGMILARIVIEGRWIRLGLGASVAIVAVVYAISLVLPPLYTMAAVYVIPVTLLIGATAVSDIAGRRNFLNRPTTVWLGEISYAFYLVHVVVLLHLHAALNGKWAGYLIYEPPKWSVATAVLYVIAVLPLCVLLAGLLYTFVERPIMRRWARPHTAGIAGSDRSGADGTPVAVPAPETT